MPEIGTKAQKDKNNWKRKFEGTKIWTNKQGEEH